MKKSQKDIVKDQLKLTGEVSRNWCLQHYITRLSAIIYDLKREGWEFKEGFIKTEHGKDYVYKVWKR